MLRISLIVISIFWGCLIIIVGTSLFIGSLLPSKGTILITHNLFLNRQERFELYDISRQFEYSFTPKNTEGALFVSLAPHGRKMAVYTVASLSLTIKKLGGDILIDDIVSNVSLDFDTVRWSPDGRYFSYYVSGNRQATIFILDTVSGETFELPHDSNLMPYLEWSADSQYITYSDSTQESAIAQIWIADANGENPQQLTDNVVASYCPTWSPDGKTIAYLEELSNGETLRFINLDGTVPDYPSGIWRMTTCPQWSKDGQSIIFIGLDEEILQTSVIAFDLQTGDEQSLISIEQTASLEIWR